MPEDVFPPAGTPFGDRVRNRLRDERLIWFTTVGADSAPQPNPVWFLWDGEDVIIYTRADAWRLKHIRNRPRVALHFESNGTGEDVVVFKGTAEVTDDPAPADSPAYREKYADGMVAVSGSATEFSAAYPVPVRVRIERVRGY